MSTEHLESRMLGNLHVRFGVGVGVQLHGLHHVVCDTTNGQAKFDNFEGRWGDQKHLDRFMQAYAVEKSRVEARKKGYSVTETQLANGSIKLAIHVGGAA